MTEQVQRLQELNGLANVEIRQSGTTYYKLPTAFYSFLFQYASQTGEGGIANFQDTSSGYKAALHLSPSGKLLLYDISGNLIATGTTTLNPNQTYTIQSSPDLIAWSAIATNTASTSNRSISVPSSAVRQFYRAKLGF